MIQCLKLDMFFFKPFCFGYWLLGYSKLLRKIFNKIIICVIGLKIAVIKTVRDFLERSQNRRFDE